MVFLKVFLTDNRTRQTTDTPGFKLFTTPTWTITLDKLLIPLGLNHLLNNSVPELHSPASGQSH